MKNASRFQDARQPEKRLSVRRQKKAHHNEEDKTADRPAQRFVHVSLVPS
ncbi:hypothetical protein ACNKHW_05155 [Shigella flexneri]